MKENVQLYNLSNVELTKAIGMMEILSEEMNIAIRNIKEEDEASKTIMTIKNNKNNHNNNNNSSFLVL